MSNTEFDLDTLIDLMKAATTNDLEAMAFALPDERLGQVLEALTREEQARTYAAKDCTPLVEQIFGRKALVNPYFNRRECIKFLQQPQNLLLLQTKHFYPLVASVNGDLTVWMSPDFNGTYTLHKASTARLLEFLLSDERMTRRGHSLFWVLKQYADEVGPVTDVGIEAAIKALSQLT